MLEMSSTNTKSNKEHYIKQVTFLDASAFMFCQTMKFGKILFILGFFLLNLEKNILFGFRSDTHKQSQFYSEKNHWRHSRKLSHPKVR